MRMASSGISPDTAMNEVVPNYDESHTAVARGLVRQSVRGSDVLMLAAAAGILITAAVAWRLDMPELAAAVLGPILVALFLFQLSAPFYAYGFLQAVDPMFIVNRYFTAGKFIGIFLIVAALLHFRKLSVWGWPRHARPIVIWSFAFLGSASVSVLWSADPVRSLVAAAQIGVQVVLVIVTVNAALAFPRLVPRVLIWIALGAAAASFYLLVFGLAQSSYGRATLSDETNPNTAALGLAISFGCLPLLYTLWESVIIRAGALLIAGCTLTALFHTGSRAAVLAALISLPVAILFTRAGSMLKKLCLVCVIVVAAYGAGLVILRYADLGEKAHERLALILGVEGGRSVSAEVLENSRMELWKLHLESWLGTGGLGTGVGVSARAIEARYGWHIDVHSSMIGSLVEMGPIGFAAFCGLIIATARCIRFVNDAPCRVGLMMLLVTACLFMLTHTTYTTKWFWFPFAFIAAVVELDARGRTPHQAVHEGLLYGSHT